MPNDAIIRLHIGGGNLCFSERLADLCHNLSEVDLKAFLVTMHSYLNLFLKACIDTRMGDQLNQENIDKFSIESMGLINLSLPKHMQNSEIKIFRCVHNDMIMFDNEHYGEGCIVLDFKPTEKLKAMIADRYNKVFLLFAHSCENIQNLHTNIGILNQAKQKLKENYFAYCITTFPYYAGEVFYEDWLKEEYMHRIYITSMRESDKSIHYRTLI